MDQGCQIFPYGVNEESYVAISFEG